MSPSLGAALLGWGLIAIAFWFAVRRILVFSRWHSTTCKVLRKRIIQEETPGGGPTMYLPEIDVEYVAGGAPRRFSGYAWWRAAWRSRNGAQKVLNRFDEGKAYPCWFDPADPSKATLTRGTTGQAAALAFLAAAGIALLVVASSLGKANSPGSGEPAPEDSGYEVPR